MPELLSPSVPQAQFVTLLRELFQIHDLDLDFGIYRVLNQERKLIGEFLDTRLGPIVREALEAPTTRSARPSKLNSMRLQKARRN